MVESRHPAFAAGNSVVGKGGWQQYSVISGTAQGAVSKVGASGDAMTVSAAAARLAASSASSS